MRSLEFLSVTTFALLAGALPASASSSAWHDGQGGRVRIVTSGTPDQAGQIHGALEIALDPGWKTYWRDPGDSGVPPQIDIGASTNVTGAELAFPAPSHHDDGYGEWAGYDRSVSFPVIFSVAAPKDKSIIEADIFLGICQTICIPVQARLTVDPAADPDNEDDAAHVRAARAALPGPARPGFEARPLPGDHETLNVEAAAPGEPASIDLFIAGGKDYMFGAPVRAEQDGKVTFSIPILDRPTTTPAEGGLHYTLTGPAGAVSGLLSYP